MRFLGIVAVGLAFEIPVVEALAGWAIAPAMQPDKAGEALLHRLGERVIGHAHIGEHRTALRRGHFLCVQDREARQVVVIGRVGVPVGGALDAEPVDLAVGIDIGQPRDFRVFGVAVLDERMDPRPTEAPAKGGKFGGAEVLVAEHQHRMLGEGALDPAESRVVQRP